MNWQNLKENKCPKCGKDFMDGLSVDKESGMMFHPCGFKIRERRYKEIVTDMVSSEIAQADGDND